MALHISWTLRRGAIDHSHHLSQKADFDGYVSPLQSSTSLASHQKEAGGIDVGLTRPQSGLQSEAACEHCELVKEEEGIPGAVKA